MREDIHVGMGGLIVTRCQPTKAPDRLRWQFTTPLPQGVAVLKRAELRELTLNLMRELMDEGAER